MNKRASLSIKQVKAQFQAWRKRRSGREPIPDTLWSAANSLLEKYPISQICRELRVNYNQIQKHREVDKRIAQPRPSSKPPFLQLTAGDLIPTTQAPKHETSSNMQAEAGCQIILERSDGSRLIINLRVNSDSLPAVCANLLRG